MNFCIVITQPFKRVCSYTFDTKDEAKQFVGTLSTILGLEITAEIVPAQLLSSYYDA